EPARYFGKPAGAIRRQIAKFDAHVHTAKALNLMRDNRVARPGLKPGIICRWIEYSQAVRFAFAACGCAVAREFAAVFQVIAQQYWANELSFFIKRVAKSVPTQCLYQEFHARLHARFALAIS